MIRAPSLFQIPKAVAKVRLSKAMMKTLLLGAVAMLRIQTPQAIGEELCKAHRAGRSS